MTVMVGEIEFLSACTVECYSAVALMRLRLVAHLQVIESNAAVIICRVYCYHRYTKPSLCNIILIIFKSVMLCYSY